MIWIIFILAGLLILVAMLWLRARAELRSFRRDASRLIHKLTMDIWELRDKYQALEQGMDEQQESFEQDLLSLQDALADSTADKINLMTEKVARERYVHELEDIVERHRHSCLPNLAHMSSIDA